MRRGLLLLMMVCLLVCFCGCNDADSDGAASDVAGSLPEMIVVSSLAPAEGAQSGVGTAPAVDIDPEVWPYWYKIPSGRYVPMTPELYDAKGRGASGFAYFTGLVLEAEVKADAYSTLYCHVTAETADGKTYGLLLDYTHHPYDFEVGETYLFYVNLAAARGALIDYAREDTL